MSGRRRTHAYPFDQSLEFMKRKVIRVEPMRFPRTYPGKTVQLFVAPSSENHRDDRFNGYMAHRPRCPTVTVRTVPTEIQLPKSTEIKSIHVAFQTDEHFQSPRSTEIFSSIQSILSEPQSLQFLQCVKSHNQGCPILNHC